jgi:hypothetical protein
VPELFRAELKQRASIDEHATDYLPAEKAVRIMEDEVVWCVVCSFEIAATALSPSPLRL